MGLKLFKYATPLHVLLHYISFTGGGVIYLVIYLFFLHAANSLSAM